MTLAELLERLDRFLGDLSGVDAGADDQDGARAWEANRARALRHEVRQHLAGVENPPEPDTL